MAIEPLAAVHTGYVYEALGLILQVANAVLKQKRMSRQMPAIEINLAIYDD